jgi:hypothetical protein
MSGRSRLKPSVELGGVGQVVAHPFELAWFWVKDSICLKPGPMGTNRGWIGLLRLRKFEALQLFRK